jgi:hypothetical protein
MNESKRTLIFVPQINPSTFLLFYFEGDRASRSYSLRDFSDPRRTAITLYADKFPYTAGEILDLARREGNYCLPARPHRVEDVSFWHSEILKANHQFLSAFKEARLEGSGQISATADQDDAVSVEPLPRQTDLNSESDPSIAKKTCACGCGQEVNKHGYVWGHKSGSRINTVAMAAKHLNGDGEFNSGKNHIQLAIEQMFEEIAGFEEEIVKRKVAIEALEKLVRNEARYQNVSIA